MRWSLVFHGPLVRRSQVNYDYRIEGGLWATGVKLLNDRGMMLTYSDFKTSFDEITTVHINSSNEKPGYYDLISLQVDMARHVVPFGDLLFTYDLEVTLKSPGFYTPVDPSRFRLDFEIDVGPGAKFELLKFKGDKTNTGAVSSDGRQSSGIRFRGQANIRVSGNDRFVLSFYAHAIERLVVSWDGSRLGLGLALFASRKRTISTMDLIDDDFSLVSLFDDD